MRYMQTLLWTSVGACLVAGGTLLLFACDFKEPSFLSFNGRFCPGTLDFSGLEAERARADDLRNAIHNAEVKLAELPNCASSPGSPPPEGPKVGRHGVLEITLWWNTIDDLDLEVRCPGGLISPFEPSTLGPGICGDGQHDIDANRNMEPPVTTNPREHVVWTKDIPEGLYKVIVQPTKTSGGSPIPYSVRVDFEGESRLCTGTVQWNGSTGYMQFPIEFRPHHPLPECSINQNAQVHACDLNKPHDCKVH